MLAKTIFLLEDDPNMRRNLERLLKRCGFIVLSAKSVEQADELLSAYEGHLDLLLLDQNLENFGNPSTNTTGAEYGIEVRERAAFQNDPPECIVFSGEKSADDLLQVLELGVAAFISKDSGTEYLLAHIRALFLRHALKPTRPQFLEMVRQITAKAPNAISAMNLFCQKLLVPQLKACLGNPFFVFLESLEGVRLFHDGSEAGGCVPSLDGLLDPHAKHKVWSATEKEREALASYYPEEKISDIRFVSLFKGDSIRLVLGFAETSRSADDISMLTTAFHAFLKPDILSGLVNLINCLSIKSMSFVDASMQICEKVSQKLDELAYDLEENEQLRQSPGECADQLRKLARSLGEGAIYLEEGSKQSSGGRISLWKEMAEDIVKECSEWDIQILGEDFHIPRPGEFRRSLYNLVDWLGQRGGDGQYMNAIIIRGQRTAQGVQILVEDHGKRLPLKLREDLFQEFSGWHGNNHDDFYNQLSQTKQYLERSRGWISDHTEDMPGEEGHRFALALPSMEY